MNFNLKDVDKAMHMIKSEIARELYESLITQSSISISRVPFRK